MATTVFGSATNHFRDVLQKHTRKKSNLPSSVGYGVFTPLCGRRVFLTMTQMRAADAISATTPEGRGAIMKLAVIIFPGIVLFLSCLLESAKAQGTVTFDGNPQVASGDIISVSLYSESGMRFRPINSGEHFTRTGGGNSGFPENGTAYTLYAFGDSLAATNQTGGRFGVLSVELSEFSTLYQFPATVQFIGYKPDGSTVTTDFVTDGIVDGTGPLADFQTFYFDSRFGDLVRIEVPTYGYALDNMVFSSVVPEPSTCVLLLAGGAFFWLLRFRK